MSFYSDCKNYRLYNPLRVLQYLFPKDGNPEINIDDSRWGKNLATLNPFFAAALIALIAYWPSLLVHLFGINPGYGLLLGNITKVVVVVCIASLIFLLTLAFILRKKKRSPTVPLALTIVTPFQFTVSLLFISLMGWMIIPKSNLLSDTAKCKLIRKAYLQTSDTNTIPNEKFWGLELGVDTYENILTALDKTEAQYELMGYLNSPKLPLIKVKSSKNFSVLGNIRGIDLYFDTDKKLYSIVIIPIKNSIVNSLSGQLEKVFKSKYQPLMNRVGLRYKELVPTFFTPSGVKIEILTNIYLSLPEKERAMNLARKRIEIEQGNKLSPLLGEP